MFSNSIKTYDVQYTVETDGEWISAGGSNLFGKAKDRYNAMLDNRLTTAVRLVHVADNRIIRFHKKRS